MEFDLSFIFTAALLLLSTLIFSLIKSWTNPKPHQNMPPSPPKLPVIGHLHLLAGDLPHCALRRLAQKHGPVIHLMLGEVPAVIISSPEATKEVLKVQEPACADKPESIASKILWYNYTDIAFSAYNDYWRQMRKICIVELLSTKNVRSFAHIRRDESSRLMTSLAATPPGAAVDVTEKLFTFTSIITCRAAFGKVLTDREGLIALFKEAVPMAGGFELADLFPSWKLLGVLSWSKYRLWRMRGKLDAILDGIIDEHVGKKSGEFGGEDVVDALIRLQQSGELQYPITNDNIKAVIFDLFVAGTETSSTTTVWAMSELMRNPHVMEKAQAEVREAFEGKTTPEENDIQELKYLKLVIKETLRLHPPIPIIPRQSRSECNVDGYTIPIKTKVMFNLWSINRDPKYWDEPEIFRPERFENSSRDFLGNDFEYIPFGAGRRMCPGINFALANIELPLAKMLYHFDWKLPKGMSCDNLDMSEGVGITVPKKKPLIIIPILRNIPPN